MKTAAAFVLVLALSATRSSADSLSADLAFLADDQLDGRGGGQLGERLAAAYIAGAFSSCGLEPVTETGFWQPFEFEAAGPGNGPTTLASQNVLGLLEGERSDEIVMVGAHYDGMGSPGEADPGRRLRPEDASDTHWNGANDNASSIALMLEVARRMCAATSPPRRSVLFVAFGAEEHGLGGSLFLVNHPPRRLEDVVAFVNLEQVGSRPGEEMLSAATGTSPMWSQAIQAANQRTGAATTVAIEALIADTDHYAPALSGIPSITVGHGDGPEGHSPGDDLSVIDYPSLTRRAEYVEVLLDVLTKWPTRPEWTVAPDHYLGATAATADAGERVAAGLPADSVAFKIVGLLDGGQADQAGISIGDLIVEVDRQPISETAVGTSLNYRMLDKEPDEALTLGLLREGSIERIAICKGPCAR